MHSDLNLEKNVESVEERENVSELEPLVLARVTEVTGSGGGHADDGDNIVWGNDPM